MSDPVSRRVRRPGGLWHRTWSPVVAVLARTPCGLSLTNAGLDTAIDQPFTRMVSAAVTPSTLSDATCRRCFARG